MELLESQGADENPGREYRDRLEQTIDTLRGLAESASTGIERGRWLQNLANSLRRRSELWPAQDSRRQADLRDALAATERGIAGAEATSEWDRVHLLVTRAELLRLLAGNRIDAAVEEAHITAVDAARRTGHVKLLSVARNWQRLLFDAGRWLDAAAAGEAALSILEKLVESQPHHQYKQVYLREGAGLAAATAFARVRAGDSDGAVPTLERVLAVVWRQRYLGPRRVATRLIAAGSPELAKRYLSLVADARAVDAADTALRAAEQQLADLQPEIDGVLGSEGPGFSTAGAPERQRTVPSLHLLTSASGSVALLRDPKGHVRSIDLPDAPRDALHRMAARFHAEVVSEAASDDQAYAAAGEIVSWLEEAVLRPIEVPIVDLLAGCSEGARGADVIPAARQTLIVVATGPFAGLPLHATRLVDGRPAATLGLSYAPALAALDNDSPHLDFATDVLVVADPANPGREQLEGAIQERRALAGTWPDAVVLSGSSATLSTVRAALPPAALIHFACHGNSDDTEPLRSAVALADGDFTMRDVLSSQLRRGCMVVLSACQTAVSDPSVPDEAMSLAGGFLAAGAGTVVASLWPVPDYPTAALMGAFHEKLRAGWPPAHALGAAQGAMAAGLLTDPDGEDWRSPYFWAGFAALGGARTDSSNKGSVPHKTSRHRKRARL